ncbi:AT-hook motif nuclear-localized protein 10 [Nymphaea thermarum]|nr:AT-hook motif nuclear-localized protein 10 [Nymphaea thermarum]
MSFMQQQKDAFCIVSANGSISNASLRQPAMTGGTITYEGQFEIMSLSGSFLHAEIGGASSRTGGLSVCLSGADGRIVGGGVGGPLIAASPVQIIICSFVIDGEKDIDQAEKTDSSVVKSPPCFPGSSITPVSLRPMSDSKILGRGNGQDMIECGSMFQAPHMVSPRLTCWSGHMNLDGKFPSKY